MGIHFCPVLTMNKKLLIRIIIVGIPLLLLYIGFLIATESNNQKQYRTDVGLGFGILLFVILLTLATGFLIDFINNLYRKDYKVAMLDIPFLIIFLMPILYLHCQMGGFCDSFCEWYIQEILK